MLYDAVSYTPERPFRIDNPSYEYNSAQYCLSLSGAITLHLKESYMRLLLSGTIPEQRQLRRWYFYTAHLNALYLLLDSATMHVLQLCYFDLQEITTRNCDVLSGSGVGIAPFSNRSIVTNVIRSSGTELGVPQQATDYINTSFLLRSKILNASMFYPHWLGVLRHTKLRISQPH